MVSGVTYAQYLDSSHDFIPRHGWSGHGRGSFQDEEVSDQAAVIEDQGSFYIGGVPKVTNYAPEPTLNNPELTPNQITIGQMYVRSCRSRR